MAYSDSFLDELRAALPVSAVVGRRHKLKKDGGEFRSIEDASLTVNDKKRLWWNHGKESEGGDIFDWLIKVEGLEFKAAVEECASMAGLSVPKDVPSRTRPAAAASPQDDGPPPWGDDAPPPADDPRFAPQRPKRETVETYDYTDATGGLIYQVCRIQFKMPDGSWETGKSGKIKKSFMQRRPSPDGDGSWILGLSAGEFIRGRDGNWYQATEDRVEKWHGADRRTFSEPAAHGLYRLVEFVEERDPEQPVWMPEGERKVDALREWGLVATGNSGGAENWRDDHAEMFRGLDVIVMIDNDEAGRKRGDKVARSLRRHGASRVRVLDFSTVWPDAPKGADIIDWRRAREGSREELQEIAEALPEWSPPPFNSRFGLIMWGDHVKPAEQYEYLIEDLIPQQENVLIQGESQSGKSFKTMGMAMAGARGEAFFGKRVLKPFGVVYCAYEGGKGFRNRMVAHERHFGVDASERIPFAVLTKPIDLWSNELNTDQIIDEVLGIADSCFGDVPLGAVVIDTHNRANPGASEIDSKDISKIIDRYSRMNERTKAGVWIIGHKNSSGKHRGNEQLYNNIETVIDISRVTDSDSNGKNVFPLTDVAGRPIRRAKVIKQREGEDGVEWNFVLASVDVGISRYGKPRTSCVALPPRVPGEDSDDDRSSAAKSLSLSDQQTNILNALKNALAEVGVPPPAELKLPQSIRTVCTVAQWYEAYRLTAGDTNANAIKQAMKRANDKMLRLRVMGRRDPHVWLTGRPVKDVIEGTARYGRSNDQDPPKWLDEAPALGLDGDIDGVR